MNNQTIELINEAIDKAVNVQWRSYLGDYHIELNIGEVPFVDIPGGEAELKHVTTLAMAIDCSKEELSFEKVAEMFETYLNGYKQAREERYQNCYFTDIQTFYDVHLIKAKRLGFYGYCEVYDFA